MCLSGNEMLCKNGGIVGLYPNEGFAECILVSDKNCIQNI
jgi:D-arabinose 1-dehydrogenase-like Zn-dependent alcohol dehydrogenase